MSIADRNEIYLSGTVIRKNKYNGIVFINISTGTYVKNGHKYYTSPTVIFLNELAAEADKYGRGSHIDIKAAVTTRRVRQADGKIRYIQSITGTSIQASRSLLNEVLEIESEAERPPINRLLVCGSVYSIAKVTETLVRIGIGSTTVINKRRMRAIIMCSYFCLNADNVLKDIHIKDRVCGAGTVQTHRFERDGKPGKIDTIVLSELQKF